MAKGCTCPADDFVTTDKSLDAQANACTVHGRDECEHGSLRRSCEICERDTRIAELVAENNGLKSLLTESANNFWKLTEERNNLKSLLRRVEWVHDSYICHFCWQRKADGHAEDCELSAGLGGK